MASNGSNLSSDQQDGFVFTTSEHRNKIKFGILLFLQICSFICYLYLFYQLNRKRHSRGTYFHHVILLLLIISFLFITIPLPLTEAYLFTSYVYPANSMFCSFWIWIHYSLNIINLYLMAFACMERNWLIFYPKFVMSKFCLFAFHYLPLAFCILFPPIFYFAAIFIHQCEQYYNYTQLLCKWPCYFYNELWTNIDLFINNCIPLFSIPVFCFAIYLRFFIQKRALKRQVFRWRRDRKLILQLWAISSLYLAMWMPMQILTLINTYWDHNFLLQVQIDYLFLLPYFIHLIYPFVLLVTQRHELLNFLSKHAVSPLSFIA